MSKPVLTIVAGCNGSGKSTYSKNLVQKNVIPFDYDKRLKENYDSLIESDVREIMARNLTTNEFKNFMNESFSRGEDICYETNFNSHPLYWAKIAKKKGYALNLHFFCLASRELAKERVKIRYRNNGHYVPDDIVIFRWKEGYKNLNLFYDFFDQIVLFDNSSSSKPVEALFSIKNDQTSIEVHKYVDVLPEYSQRRFPNICKLLTE